MPILAHSWISDHESDVASANIEPMILVPFGDKGKTAVELAETAYAECAAKANGRRAVFLRHAFEQIREDTTHLNSRNYFDFMTMGPTSTEWRALMTEFWETWKAQGSIRPNRIIAENEKGYSWFRMPGATNSAQRAAAIQSVRDAGYSHLYLAEFAEYSQADLAAYVDASSPSSRGVVLHDISANRLWGNALTELTVGIYESVMGTTCPPCSNYENNRVFREYVDPSNTRILPNSNAVGSDSSPVLYPYTDKARFTGISNAAGRRDFAAFKGAIEHLRAVQGPVCPWIGAPGYRDDTAARSTVWAGWRKWVHQLALHGVSEVLYFVGSYGETTQERAYAEETFATATVVPRRPGLRYPVPVVDGTTTIATGNGQFTTTDFAYVQEDWV